MVRRKYMEECVTESFELAILGGCTEREREERRFW